MSLRAIWSLIAGVLGLLFLASALFWCETSITATEPCETAQGRLVVITFVVWLIGFFILTAIDRSGSGSAKPTGPTKLCPDCAEPVQSAAKVCKHCGYRFEDTASETQTPSPSPVTAPEPVTASAPTKVREPISRTTKLVIVGTIVVVLALVGGGLVIFGQPPAPLADVRANLTAAGYRVENTDPAGGANAAITVSAEGGQLLGEVYEFVPEDTLSGADDLERTFPDAPVSVRGNQIYVQTNRTQDVTFDAMVDVAEQSR